MNTRKFPALLILMVTALWAGCTVSKTPAPPLAGPSELGLSFQILANPDVISQDGASQALVVVQAFDPNGQPAKNVPLRAEILFNGVLTDWGTLSARNIVTDNNGRASLIYTAPPAPIVSVASSSFSNVTLLFTPVGTDSANHEIRSVNIRLVPPGVIPSAGGPTAEFTVTPLSPSAFVPATFDAFGECVVGKPDSCSSAGPTGVIVSASWNFGDGSAASGSPAIHQFANTGTYIVTLTLMDNNGVTGTKSKTVTVIAGNQPTAQFVMSPSGGAFTNQTIFFNASQSRPGDGRRLVRYDWDFGTGSTGSGVTTSKSYDSVGTYTIVLTVTDDVGQTARVTGTVSIQANPTSLPTARFFWSPNPARQNEPTTFDASPSSTSISGTIIRYDWNFNDGSNPITSTTSPTIQHTFFAQSPNPIPGGYPVRLTVTDSNGQTSPPVTQQVVVQ